MRVIDLLVKISKGEEVPKKIRIDDWRYKFEWEEDLDNYYDNSEDIDLMSALSMSKEELNYGVEIIEEEKKIELPEKLEIEQDTPSSNYYIRNEFGTKCGLTKHSKMIVEKLNETLGYLKYKEEESKK